MARQRVAQRSTQAQIMTLRTGNPAFDVQLVESFETALRAGWQQARSNQTIRTYGYGLKFYLGYAQRQRLPPLTEITPTHAQGYVIELRSERSASTAQLYLLAGHTDLRTLTIYTRMTDQGRALRAHETYSPLDAIKRGPRR